MACIIARFKNLAGQAPKEKEFMRSNNLGYRPDIDGLRAIAVLLVLLFHFGLGVPGGFIGVDVFFVISGFLITEVIRNAIKKEQFSFIDFYSRRLRRLHPALTATVALSLIAGFFLMDPASLAGLAKSSIPTLFSFSNIYFWQNQGYFDAAAHTQPLLHTWSLATEWQFYAIWPLIIWLTLKLNQKTAAITLGALTIASAITSQAMLSYNASASYFMMPFRIFELSLGGILVFFFHNRLEPLLESCTFILGLVLIFISAFAFNSSSPYPGFRALLPCIGAAACIYGGQAKIANYFTALKPMTYLGIISYSVYLIHWPLLVFYKYYIFRELNFPEQLVLLSLSIIFGAVLYHSIERIFMGKYRFRKHFMHSALAISVVTVAAFATLAIQTDGLVNRINAKYLALTKDPKNFHINNYGGAGFSLSPTLGDANGKKIAIMAGDSFAHQYASGIDKNLKNTGKSIPALYMHGCILSKEYTRLLDGVPRQDCRDTYSKILELLSNNNLPFIFAEGWPAYPVLVADHTGKNAVTAEKDYFAVIEDMLLRARDDIGDRDFIIVGSQPIPPGTPPTVSCLLRPRYLPQGCEQFLEFRVEHSSAYKVNEVLKKFAATHKRTFYVDALDTFCLTGTCNTVIDGKILYSDSAHLSIDGSTIAAKKILEEIHIKTGLRTTSSL
ncbi:acyltransferase family protein [Pseudomonas sp. TNT2022 ID642]|uniref:acyltransferase family protein n=1 Tax=Pseudomonas sp. TNT2022 ID642 TaxID=2942632 RepID=UPI002362C145|nr:acyltransferase family protein [Pseudomonas sp. TNT2022 ID642]MDD1002454.1 acyltransferase [Pseudomonas sp. TNT2022 ID642]